MIVDRQPLHVRFVVRPASSKWLPVVDLIAGTPTGTSSSAWAWILALERRLRRGAAFGRVGKANGQGECKGEEDGEAQSKGPNWLPKAFSRCWSSVQLIRPCRFRARPRVSLDFLKKGSNSGSRWAKKAA